MEMLIGKKEGREEGGGEGREDVYMYMWSKRRKVATTRRKGVKEGRGDAERVRGREMSTRRLVELR